MDIYERILPVATLVLGSMLPYAVHAVAEWVDEMRPGKKLQQANETLNHIAAQLKDLPNASSLTELIGQVEKLERAVSQGNHTNRKHRTKKNKATPKPVVQHVNGAAN